MNIWIFNHYALPPDQAGGTRHFDFARELVQRGYEVTVFASNFHYNRHQYFRHIDGNSLEEFIDGVRFIWIPVPAYWGNGWKRLRNMLIFAKRVVPVALGQSGSPDVVIGSTVHLHAVKAAYKIAKERGCPFVMEVRDLWPQTLIDMGVSRWHPLVLWLGFLEKWLYKRADAIIVSLPKAVDYISNLGISRDKVHWITNGTDLSRFKQLPDPPGDKGEFVLVYTGTHGTANYLELLLQAAQKVQAVNKVIHIRLIGDGPEKESLKQLSEKLELTNVSFSNSVSKQELPKVMEAADAFVVLMRDLPLYRFGISFNKLFDYLATGRPVIFSSSLTDNPVSAAEAGIVTPAGDAEKLADAILQMADMPLEKRIEMGQRGRQEVVQKYSINYLTSQLESLLNKLIRQASED